MCCNNVAKVQKISETTKHFANFFYKNLQITRKTLPQIRVKVFRGRETPNKKRGKEFRPREIYHLFLGQGIPTSGNQPSESGATNSDHGKSTTYFWDKESRPREIDYLFLGQRIPTTGLQYLGFPLFHFSTSDIYIFRFYEARNFIIIYIYIYNN